MHKIFSYDLLIKNGDKILNNPTKSVVDYLITTCEDETLNNQTTKLAQHLKIFIIIIVIIIIITIITIIIIFLVFFILLIIVIIYI